MVLKLEMGVEFLVELWHVRYLVALAVKANLPTCATNTGTVINRTADTCSRAQAN